MLNGFNIRGRKNPNAFVIYTFLTVNAQYHAEKVNGITLDVGDILTSVRRLSAESGLSESETRTALKNLTECGYIRKKSATRSFTVISVCGYAEIGRASDNLSARIKNYAEKNNLSIDAAAGLAEILTAAGLTTPPKGWQDILKKLDAADEARRKNILTEIKKRLGD